ncbi:HesA/MoeB/ThiF family protein [Levilactobacillus spicheri]|uniref:THIF-type NAD/FAD binding fold domain-containing protein n=1 Tax=Levilactobacillus spicheri TaxID=216463 RepID=A0A0F3RVQ2_9LACO|nr:ThiF family adenylyltransferase [Levilactobacillus spicheri]KJW13684.1 hypothetical protein VC81_01965 [Levilactobacillus spicheri]
MKLPELQKHSRYGYQLLYLSQKYAQFNLSEQELLNRLGKFKLCIIGAGAIGSFIAAMGAAVGIGTIRMIDGDIVEESNLTRQIFYKESDIGNKAKVNSIRDFVCAFNSSVVFEAVDHFVEDDSQTLKDFDGMNLIIQTADQPVGVIDEIVANNAQKVNVLSVYVHSGTFGPFIVPNETKTFSDFEASIDESTNGLYTKFIHNVDPRSRTAFPAIANGALSMSAFIFDKIIEFAISKDIPELRNYYWLEKNRTYVEF